MTKGRINYFTARAEAGNILSPENYEQIKTITEQLSELKKEIVTELMSKYKLFKDNPSTEENITEYEQAWTSTTEKLEKIIIPDNLVSALELIGVSKNTIDLLKKINDQKHIRDYFNKLEYWPADLQTLISALTVLKNTNNA